MDGKMLARLGAVAFVAVAVTATAIEMTRKEEEPPVQASRQSEEAPGDPLREAQRLVLAESTSGFAAAG